MKFFKWTLAILAFLLIAFILAGVIRPSIEYETKVMVDATPGRSFRVYQDISRMPEWLEGFAGIRLLSGRLQEVGSEYEVVMLVEGERMVMKEVITAFEKNELFAFRLENEMFTSETEVRFRAVNGMTEISSTNKVQGKNAFWRSLFAFMQSQFRESGQRVYENLKKVIEEDPAG